MSSMTEDQTYQGWANYPTWNVNLWLSNDEGLYNRTVATLEGAKEFYNDDEEEHGPWRVFVADWLRDYVNDDILAEGLAPGQSTDNKAGMVDDLTTWALGQVDWLELADAWLEA